MKIFIVGDPEKAKEWVFQGMEDYFKTCPKIDFDKLINDLKKINPKAYRKLTNNGTRKR